ncbi:MAG: sensor histidine kinase [Calditerrivibrio sp.]
MNLSQVVKLINKRLFLVIFTSLILLIISLYLILNQLIFLGIFINILTFSIILAITYLSKRDYEATKNEFLEMENNFNMLRNKLEEQILEVNTSNNELKTLNIELIKAKNKLEELSNYRGRFIANMSHELRTPLNAIIGFSHILLMQPDFGISEEEKNNLIKTIHNSGKKLLNIINNILDLSDLKQDIMEPNPKYIDIAPSLEALSSTAKGLLKDNRSILLNIKLKNIYPNVYADEKALNKVLTHILENAVKYTKKGEISIYTEEDEERLYIVVSDTGIGMTEDELKRVFEPFTKMLINDQPISLSEGVGIGMPISKYLMEKMSGDLLVESKKDYGTIVKMVLKKEPIDE